MVAVLLFCAAATGYLAGTRQANPGPGAPQKIYNLKFGSLNLHLTIGAMGVLVIFILMVLLAAAMVLALVAYRRSRLAEAANRKLVREMAERRLAEEEVNRLNADLERRVEERTEELFKANQLMIRRNAELLVVNKELESFSYSVSHDLRSPLRAIHGFSVAIQEDCAATLDAQAKLYLQRILVATVRMGQLIDGMLELARTARCAMRHEQVSLSDLAGEVVSQLEKSEPDRRVTIEIAPDLVVNGDQALLHAVLQNLIGNAWKFTSNRSDARIELGTMTQEGPPVYFVRDNGAGFDMHYAGQLFGAFQRLHDAREFPGTGIGLATVQRIIQRHGGRIWAESTVGHGATFYFALETADGLPAAAASSAVAG
jgi:light-regulated signal transduction histidine kinase (bacteriophytochrome)